MIDRIFFFENYIKIFSKPSETQKQSLEKILKFLDDSRFDLSTQYAYILATIALETNFTFEPVLEGYYIKNNRIQKLYNFYRKYRRTIFPNGLNYPTYEGRGYCQTTHNYNYDKFRELVRRKFNVDIFLDPDKVLNSEISWFIFEVGISERKYCYTGKIIYDYIRDGYYDYYNARRVINGRDFNEIKNYSEKFHKMINFI